MAMWVHSRRCVSVYDYRSPYSTLITALFINTIPLLHYRTFSAAKLTRDHTSRKAVSSLRPCLVPSSSVQTNRSSSDVRRAPLYDAQARALAGLESQRAKNWWAVSGVRIRSARRGARSACCVDYAVRASEREQRTHVVHTNALTNAYRDRRCVIVVTQSSSRGRHRRVVLSSRGRPRARVLLAQRVRWSAEDDRGS